MSFSGSEVSCFQETSKDYGFFFSSFVIFRCLIFKVLRAFLSRGQLTYCITLFCVCQYVFCFSFEIFSAGLSAQPLSSDSFAIITNHTPFVNTFFQISFYFFIFLLFPALLQDIPCLVAQTTGKGDIAYEKRFYYAIVSFMGENTMAVQCFATTLCCSDSYGLFLLATVGFLSQKHRRSCRNPFETGVERIRCNENSNAA